MIFHYTKCPEAKCIYFKIKARVSYMDYCIKNCTRSMLFDPEKGIGRTPPQHFKDYYTPRSSTLPIANEKEIQEKAPIQYCSYCGNYSFTIVRTGLKTAKGCILSIVRDKDKDCPSYCDRHSVKAEDEKALSEYSKRISERNLRNQEKIL